MENDGPVIHKFGRRLGIWYPLLSKILSFLHQFWPSVRLIPEDNHFATDLYLGICWLTELVGALICAKYAGWSGKFAWFLLIFCCYRFADILFVVVSILYKGFYRKRSSRSSAYRLLLLGTLNAFEVMFIFAIFYMAFSEIFPQSARIEPALTGIFHSLYFSIITGTTLGYGIPNPVGWLAQMLVIIEVLTILLGVIVLIGRIAGAVDTETVTER